MRITAAIALLLTTASTGVQGFRPLARQTVLPFARAMSSEIPNTVEEWKSKLNAEQFEVLRRKATEPPGYSERKEGQLEYELKKNYGTKYPEKGNYNCVGCGTPLYTAKSKFDSGCGWPAFDSVIPGAVKEVPDADGRRVEIVCAKCDSHLGHVFRGEGFTPTNERHCVNGICLAYNPDSA